MPANEVERGRSFHGDGDFDGGITRLKVYFCTWITLAILHSDSSDVSVAMSRS